MTSIVPDPAAAVRAHALLLAWYRDMGVDHAVGVAAVNWLERGDQRPGADFQLPAQAEQTVEAARSPARPPVQHAAPRSLPARQPLPTVALATAPSTNRQFPTATLDDATLAARAAAKEAVSLEDLEGRLRAFDGCGLKATAKSLCFFRGAGAARVMVVGDAPGADDDKVGQPFTGAIGGLLDQMFAAIGLDSAKVHITNTVYWRPPGGRPPTAQEMMICRPFIERQMALVKPDVLVLLGGAASNMLLGNTDGIARLRGKWTSVDLEGRRIPALPMLHPRDLLRTPLAKRMAWKDLLAVAAALDEKSTT